MSIHKSRILYQDDDLLAVSKLSCELVVKGKGRVDKLPLFDLLKQDYPGLRVLHRLDFETSGVVLFAKNKATEQKIIADGFQNWRKIYQALVMGRMQKKQGTVSVPLPARGQGKVPAVSHFRVLDRFVNSTFVEVQIETGRYHQIRRHFAHINHPLVLDDLYGHRKFNRLFTHEFGYRMFFLHASALILPHPVTGETISISAPMPQTFSSIVRKLKSLR